MSCGKTLTAAGIEAPWASQMPYGFSQYRRLEETRAFRCRGLSIAGLPGTCCQREDKGDMGGPGSLALGGPVSDADLQYAWLGLVTPPTSGDPLTTITGLTPGVRYLQGHGQGCRRYGTGPKTLQPGHGLGHRRNANVWSLR